MTLKSLDNITISLRTIDIINYLEKTVVTGLINEIPTRLSFVRFQTSKPYVSGSLKYFLNGLKEAKADITEISTTIFEIAEAVIAEDDVEIEYLERP